MKHGRIKSCCGKWNYLFTSALAAESKRLRPGVVGTIEEYPSFDDALLQIMNGINCTVVQLMPFMFVAKGKEKYE